MGGIPFLIQTTLFLRRQSRDRDREAPEEAVKAVAGVNAKLHKYGASSILGSSNASKSLLDLP